MIRKSTIVSISQDWSKNYSMSYSWLEGEPNSSNWSISDRSQIGFLVWSVNWAEDELGSRRWGNRL